MLVVFLLDVYFNYTSIQIFVTKQITLADDMTKKKEVFSTTHYHTWYLATIDG